MTNARTARASREEKVAQMRREVARSQARKRYGIVLGSVVVVVAIIAGAFLLVQSQQNTKTASATAPANLGEKNSFVVGKSTAKVTLVAYEDFQCPICEQFEQLNSAQITQWINDGTLRVEYRPIAILDRESSTEYSTRALNAAAAVVNSTPGAFAKFHQLLYANQPAEGSSGLTDQQLIDYAVQAGAPKGSVTKAVNDHTYYDWAAKVTDDSSKAGITGTPTLIVNGTTLKSYDAATVTAAVEAAAK